MKFVSWNVNGLRACMGKGFMESFNEMDADFFCLQETKLQPDQINLELPGSVYNMMPYIICLIVLAFTSKNSKAPKAEGIPYDKGQR